MNSLIIFSASYLYLVVVLIAFVFFLKQPRNIQKSMLICGIIILPISYILAKIGGHFYYDARPFVVGQFIPLIPHVADNGFPSDHMLLTGAIAAVVWFYNKKVSALLWALAIIVGIARVASGIHHMTDIVGSIVIVLIVSAAYYYYNFRRKTL